MTRGTTESIVIDIPLDIDLHEAKEIWVSFTQSSKVLIQRKLSDSSLEIEFGEDEDGEAFQLLYFNLEQEDTLKFNTFDKLLVGIRILLEDGQAFASDPQLFKVYSPNQGGIIE